MRRSLALLRCRRGMTLIELIVSIVVVGIALGALLGVVNTVVSRSADPLIQAQSLAIAESYLEGILLKPYPDIAAYDDPGAQSQFGAVAGLEAYQVAVAVVPHTLNAVAGKQVTVTVTHQNNFLLSLNGWRAQY